MPSNISRPAARRIIRNAVRECGECFQMKLQQEMRGVSQTRDVGFLSGIFRSYCADFRSDPQPVCPATTGAVGGAMGASLRFPCCDKELPLAREFHDSCARLLQTGLGLLQVCASLNSSAQSSDKRTFTYCWGRHLVHPLPLLLSRVPVASR